MTRHRRSRPHLDRRRASSPACQVAVGEDGRIAGRGPACGRRSRDLRLAGRALLPGFVDAHSHAFQRGLRGRGETFPAGQRQLLDLARGHVRPGRAARRRRASRRLCLQTFREMRAAGITSVGEFHYLHHRARTPTTGPSTSRCSRAAAEAGIRIALLQSYYRTGGIGQPLEGRAAPLRPALARASTGSRWTASRRGSIRAGRPSAPSVHSLRAASLEELRRDLRRGAAARPALPHPRRGAAAGDRGRPRLLRQAADGAAARDPGHGDGRHRRPLHPHRRRGPGALPRRRRHGLPLPPDRGQPRRRHRRPAAPSASAAARSAWAATRTPASPCSRRCAGSSTASAWPARAAACCGTTEGRSPAVLFEPPPSAGAQALGVEAGRIAPGLWADFVAIDLEAPRPRRLGAGDAAGVAGLRRRRGGDRRDLRGRRRLELAEIDPCADAIP